MSFIQIAVKAVSAATLAVMASAAAAMPVTWSFSQSFGAGGTITGTFTGEDLNNDQLVTYSDDALNELFGFTVSFSGPDFTASFGPGQITIGTDVTEFQYVVGSTSLDAVLPGPPVKASLVTLITPLSMATTPSDSFLFWQAGSANYDPLGEFKGNVSIFDSNSNQLGNFDSPQSVLVQVAVVPEPSTYLMILSGLAMLGFSANRRRAK